jgi:hypothetical protein
MSNFIKNMLIVFTLLCIGVLVVFCIELVMLNMDTDKDGDETPQLSSGTTSGDKDGGNEQETPDTGHIGVSEQPDDIEQTGSDDKPDDQEQSPKGKQYSLLMLDNVHILLLNVDEELFDFSEGEADWLFTYKGDGKASLEIAPDLATPQEGINGLARSLLKPYLDGGESSVRGEGTIGNSSLSGVSVIGHMNKETYEAWIYGPLAGGSSGNVLVFIANYQNDEQKDELYAILDTLEMISDETDSEETMSEEMITVA